jgi:hypothetical protein
MVETTISTTAELLEVLVVVVQSLYREHGPLTLYHATGGPITSQSTTFIPIPHGDASDNMGNSSSTHKISAQDKYAMMIQATFLAYKTQSYPGYEESA